LLFTFNNKYPLGYFIGFEICPFFKSFKLIAIFFDNKVSFIHPISPPLFTLFDKLNFDAADLKSLFLIYLRIFLYLLSRMI